MIRPRIPLCLLFILGLLFSGQQEIAHAHGGIIIDSGFLERYEWLVMVNPFPVTQGSTVITILFYDIDTYAPINDLRGELYLAPPNSPRPCCQADLHIGPLPLITETELYPGDYSTVVDLGDVGQWDLLFVIQDEQQIIQISTKIDVRLSESGGQRTVPVEGEGLAATATVLAQQPSTEPLVFTPEPTVPAANQAVAPSSNQPQSPLDPSTGNAPQTGNSPLATPAAVAASSALTTAVPVTPPNVSPALLPATVAAVEGSEIKDAEIEDGTSSPLSANALIAGGIGLLVLASVILLIAQRRARNAE